MAKANKRLKSVVEGAVEASKEARRAAAAEKIRASVATPPAASPPQPVTKPVPQPAVQSAVQSAPQPAAQPAREPKKPPGKAKRSRPATPVEPDVPLSSEPEMRLPASMTADEAKRFRETMLQSTKPKKQPRQQPAKKPAAKPADTSGGFAPIRGPGALLGKVLRETYRQAPNIAANAVAIPGLAAAGAGGAYLGTAGTLAAIRAIQKLFAPDEEPKPAAPPQEDYRSGFQRAIDQRRRPRPDDSGLIRTLTKARGLT